MSAALADSVGTEFVGGCGQPRSGNLRLAVPTGGVLAYLHGWALSCMGDFSRARDNVEEALQIPELVDHPFTTVWSHVGVGLVHLQ
jgi:hypothetical protein